MMCLCWLFSAVFIPILVVVVALLVFLVCWMLFATKSPYAQKQRHDEELYFVDENNRRVRFPCLSDEPSIKLSIIVPAYNEEHRLRPMLDTYLSLLVPVYKDMFEIIIVSDGSTDRTCDVAMEYVKNYGSSCVRLLKLVKNRGKGGAVSLGMLSARGIHLLFADADGATKIEELNKLEKELQRLQKVTEINGKGDNQKPCDMLIVVCGSRAHLESEAKAQRSIFRTLLMIGFHFHVWMFGVRSIKDTQCGFKLFTRPAAKILFNNLHVDGWAFDVEMLYIAEKLNMTIGEVAVNWTEIEGSKIVPVWSWLQMGFDVFSIWIKYRTGTWRIKKKIY